MSRTYREKTWYKRKHHWADHLETCPKHDWFGQKMGCSFWATTPYALGENLYANPGWWDHYYTTVLNRREEKRLEHLAPLLPPDEANELMWPLSRKPTVYYW